MHTKNLSVAPLALHTCLRQELEGWTEPKSFGLEPHPDLPLPKVKLLASPAWSDSVDKVSCDAHFTEGEGFSSCSSPRLLLLILSRKENPTCVGVFPVVISVHVAEITSDLRSGSACSASLYSLLQSLLSALQISSWLCCAIIFF